MTNNILKHRSLISINALIASLICLAPMARAAGPIGCDRGWACDNNGNVFWTPSVCQALSDAGIGMMRMGARLPSNLAANMWTNGSPNIATYDTVVNNLRAQGIEIVMLINGESYFNANNYDVNANAHETNSLANGSNAYIDSFVTNAVLPLVAHFHDRIKVFEIWNEEAAASTYVYPSCYSWMMTKSWRAVHVTLGYSDCLVITSDGSDGTVACGPYVTQMFQEGNNSTVNSFLSNRNLYGAYPMDGYGQHLYIDGWELAPSIDIQNCINNYRGFYTAFEGAGTTKGTWITEFGWDANYLQQRNPGWTWAQVLSVQAQNLTTSHNVFNTQGAGSFVKFTSWYNWDGTGFGLRDPSQNPRPAYTNFYNEAHYEGRTAINNGGINTNILNYYNNNGGQPVLGNPYDNGGGAYVHTWNGGNVQDFTGGSHLKLAVMSSTAAGVWEVNNVHGLWDYYLTNNGSTAFGYPDDNEYAWGNGTRQDFINGYLAWDPTAGITFTALPRPAGPSGLTATTISGSQINLAWTDNATNETAYLVERSSDSVTFAQIASLPANTTTFSDSGLAGSSTYYYRVRASNSGNPSAYSNTASATTQLGVPAAPTGLAAVRRNGYVPLSWNASSGTAATGYNVKRSTTSGGPFTTIGTSSTTGYTDNTIVNGATYYYIVSGVNGYGEGANSTQISAVPSSTALPAPWLDQDIGSVQLAGSASYSGTTFTVTGSGDDIWNSADAFHFVYQPIAGNYTLVARVATQQNTDPWAKAGVMMRETLTAGSAHAMMVITPGQGASFQWRPTTGSSMSQNQLTGVTAPYWVKVVRSGNTFSGFISANGTTWTQVGTNVTITMASTIYVGLPVVAHVYPNQVLNTSTFDNVSVPLPPVPTGLTATVVSSSQVHLAWTTSLGAGSYNVKRATVSGGPYTTVAAGVTATTYDDTGLTANTTYFYVVSAVNSAGESANSSQVSATPCAISAVPTGLTATGGNAQIIVSWAAASGATSYNLSRATNTSGPYTQIATGVTTTSYTNTGLAAGTTYFYTVAGVNSCGSSGSSAYIGATTIPPVPTGLTATAGNAQITLNWTASSGAASYNIKRATTNGGPYTTIATGITSSAYTNTGLVNGTTYYYVVSAVNSTGESANSAQASATPSMGPPAPTGLTATATGNNKDVRLNWNASSGATSYNVKRATVNGGPYTTIKTGVTATTFTDKTPVTGTLYYYVVTAVNATGESPNSNQVSIVGPG